MSRSKRIIIREEYAPFGSGFCGSRSWRLYLTIYPLAELTSRKLPSLSGTPVNVVHWPTLARGTPPSSGRQWGGEHHRCSVIVAARSPILHHLLATSHFLSFPQSWSGARHVYRTLMNKWNKCNKISKNLKQYHLIYWSHQHFKLLVLATNNQLINLK